MPRRGRRKSGGPCHFPECHGKEEYENERIVVYQQSGEDEQIQEHEEYGLRNLEQEILDAALIVDFLYEFRGGFAVEEGKRKADQSSKVLVQHLDI